MMRIAIFHDFFGSIGGGEKLALELARYLHADIITTDLNKKNLDKMGYNVKVISLGRCIQYPGIKQLHTSWKFWNANFPGYDLYIMSGNWAVFAAHRHRPNLYYIHTPVRMFYDFYDSFKKIASWKKLPFILWVRLHKPLLEKQFSYVDRIVTNSRNVQGRIRRFHKRQSVVVYPPIKHYAFRKSGDFWLSVNRIYPHKRLELQIEAFRKLPEEKLVIVGGYATGDHAQYYARKIFRELPPNVKFIGEVSEKRLEQLYGECKAFITTSEHEDFGMSVLEAMSAGKPVVASAEGGYRETVIKGTGYLVRPDVESVIAAIRRINATLDADPSYYRDACQRQAGKFSVKRFLGGMDAQIALMRQR